MQNGCWQILFSGQVRLSGAPSRLHAHVGSENIETGTVILVALLSAIAASQIEYRKHHKDMPAPQKDRPAKDLNLHLLRIAQLCGRRAELQHHVPMSALSSTLSHASCMIDKLRKLPGTATTSSRARSLASLGRQRLYEGGGEHTS
jgi:hypothetical protein